MLTRKILVLCAIVGTPALFGPGSAAAQSASVSVTEDEMMVKSSTTHVSAGKVTFVVRNTGTVEHELVIVRWTGEKLPIAKWKVDESTIKVGEVPELAPGKTGRVTLSLKPGTYLMICNIPGHYQLGMSRKLTVD
jgi:uncharacterized cupredoxin-like copper-binding protein